MLSARRAVPAELHHIGEITRAAYAEYTLALGGLPLPVTEEYAPRIEAGEVWLVSRAGADGGAEARADVAVMVLETAADALTIFSLAVLPEARGGIGRWMLAFAEAQARAAGLPEVRLYTNDRMVRNIAIYQQAGFAETGRRSNEQRPGWFLVDMTKPL